MEVTCIHSINLKSCKNSNFTAICPEKFKYVDGTCFYHEPFEGDLSWDDSRKKCSEINIESDLVIIDSQEKQDAVTSSFCLYFFLFICRLGSKSDIT